MPAKNITVIPATIDPHTRIPKAATTFRKVAGYARVSTDSVEQLTSYEGQVDYYTVCRLSCSNGKISAFFHAKSKHKCPFTNQRPRFHPKER